MLSMLSSNARTTDKIILKARAHQKPSTLNSGTSRLVNKIIIAFITSRNNPKEKNVMGMVSNIRKGFTKAFSNDNTAATISAVRNPSIFTPGRIYDVIITAKAVIIIFTNVFICSVIKLFNHSFYYFSKSRKVNTEKYTGNYFVFRWLV